MDLLKLEKIKTRAGVIIKAPEYPDGGYVMYINPKFEDLADLFIGAPWLQREVARLTLENADLKEKLD